MVSLIVFVSFYLFIYIFILSWFLPQATLSRNIKVRLRACSSLDLSKTISSKKLSFIFSDKNKFLKIVLRRLNFYSAKQLNLINFIGTNTFLKLRYRTVLIHFTNIYNLRYEKRKRNVSWWLFFFILFVFHLP